MSRMKILLIIRWIARILGAFLILLIVLLIIGEDLPRPSELSNQGIGMFFCLALMLAGLILGLTREGAGGGLVLAGFLGFALLEGEFPGGWVFPFLPLCGILYLVSFLGHRLLNRKRTAG